MTFTVDTCIVLAVVNKFDFFHKRSRKLLEKREDNMIIAFSVMNEALTTFLRKFNEVSKEIISICDTRSNSPNFFELFKKDFDKLVENESQKGKNLVNFYDYLFSLIEPYVKDKNLTELNSILLDHPLDLVVLIPERINSVKEITEIIIPDEAMKEERENIRQIISEVHFSRDLDKIHFMILCVYSMDRTIDYFTTDGNYFLLMTESLNLIKANESFNNIGLFPQYLTEEYASSL